MINCVQEAQALSTAIRLQPEGNVVREVDLFPKQPESHDYLATMVGRMVVHVEEHLREGDGDHVIDRANIDCLVQIRL